MFSNFGPFLYLNFTFLNTVGMLQEDRKKAIIMLKPYRFRMTFFCHAYIVRKIKFEFPHIINFRFEVHAANSVSEARVGKASTLEIK